MRTYRLTGWTVNVKISTLPILMRALKGLRSPATPMVQSLPSIACARGRWAMPDRRGDRAHARRPQRRLRRLGHARYGTLITEFRGHSRTVEGTWAGKS